MATPVGTFIIRELRAYRTDFEFFINNSEIFIAIHTESNKYLLNNATDPKFRKPKARTNRTTLHILFKKLF